MWNKLVNAVKDTSIKRLLLAVLVSALLHAYLFGGVDLTLPSLKKEMHTIEARIQMPKPVAKPVAQPKPVVEEIKPTPPKPEPQQPKPAPVPEPQTEPAAEAPVQPPQEVAAITPEPDPEPSSNPADLDPEPSSLPIKDEGLVINENAYRYVETYFDVRTKVGGPVEGGAKIIFNLKDDSHYEASFLVQAKGLAALLIPDLLQKSDGLLTNKGLQPNNYLYQFGDKAEKTRKVIFDWNERVLFSTVGGESKTEALVEDAQDVLSFMYQFMYVPPLQKMQLNITNGKNLREYDYQFEGEELLVSKFGELQTMHIVHKGVDSDESKELWLALDYQFIPVKILIVDKNGKTYEFVATKIVTTAKPPNK